MFDRISNGLALARSSWRVLMKDKHLLVFPVVSGVLFLVVATSFFVPLAVLVDAGQLRQQSENGRTPPWVYAVAFAFYFCTYFVTIFCNSALISCALMRFHGQTPSVGDGFRMAMARLPQIFAWALVSATVGVLLRIVEQAHEKVGQFIASLLGTAWSIMTFFVVPVLVVEKTGPFEAVSRSVALLKKTWGEALVGKVGLGLFLFLLALPVLLLVFAGFYLLAAGPVALGVAVLVAGGVVFLLYLAVSAALHTILLTALYQYAAEDRVPEEFDREVIAGSFAPKPA
jgi:hypothetical protein